ncbi:MAG: DNA polymerase III subunit delta [Hydrogenophilales bacterium 16-64-46]|nr:MAG: DNA polymerase III subunit delta [Hydrogenophilales bacterium 12-64-13]OYZ05358.1 MAG: DNA polymerase III subunit delta [Hydrogenophilales bacterium 16-64-46]OZA37712.1 MAG: DNA polymerase III subunit delta [Hydrogenophilales bacterium 17-64-34]HQS99342.1 DNA polymerase III subunit delta [Thiobacillus sp.]
MNIVADRLPEQLARGLAALYVVTGDEPLAAQEAGDAIRAAARAAGHTERSVHTVQGKYNWQGLFASGDNLSLFAERRLTEIRMPSGKPGVDGAKALETYAGKLPTDTLTLISLPGLDWKTQQSRWFAALARAGVVVEAKPVERAALPGWIERRLAKQGLKADRDALVFLADQVEGNLLAAQQEIDKLALLLPPGKVTRVDVERAVVDVSRLEADALADALYAGDAARFAQTVIDLRDSGEAVPAMLWQVASAVQTLLRLKLAVTRGDSLPVLLRALWGRDKQRAPQIERALKRLDLGQIEQALALLARTDRQSKGLDRLGDPWDSLLELGRLLAAPQKIGTEHGR